MISIIIPTYDEADQIRKTINHVWERNANADLEIIVVDGRSNDNTTEIAENLGVEVKIIDRKGRAAQMNAGAAMAKGNILYFLHADSIPPIDFTAEILNNVAEGAVAGCFRLAFDHDHSFLKANCWFTRFNINLFRFGDQSLFVTKEVFYRAGQFNPNLMIMEDQEIIHRIRKNGRFVVINTYVITSARKYIDNGIYRMQGIFFRIWAAYYLGFSQEKLTKLYRKLIRKHKL